ncbi:SCO7613 C-terminal domain-containing membrane protein [Stackebrandtia soli]|uniref:SCO7613 C-terminal domain-containing membrane protein n=1 Tax=Stackebrandtia soli TaxID=1892856 RepID=UPI0039ED5545
MPVYACPHCDAPSSPEHCPSCGRGTEPLLVDLAVLDGDLATRRTEETQLKRRLDVLRTEISGLERNRTSLLRRLAAHAAALRGRAAAQRTAPVAPPIVPSGLPVPPPAVPPGAAPVGMPAMMPPVPAAPIAPPVAPPKLPYGHIPAGVYQPSVVPGPPPPEQSARSIQTILLTLGGILSAAAAIIFTAVAWATFGLAGRAVILTVITVVALAAPFILMRRKLTATAETIAALGLLLTFCDAIALYYLDLLPGRSGGSDQPAILVLLTAVVAVAFGYRVASGMLTAGFAVPVFAVPVAIVALIQSSRPVGVVGLVALALLLAGASYWLGAHPGRAHDLLARLATGLTGGFAVGVLALAATAATSSLGYRLLAFAVTVGAALVVAHRLPAPWRIGPAVASWVGVGIAMIGAFAICLWLAIAHIPSTWSGGTAASPESDWWQHLVVLAGLGVLASAYVPRQVVGATRYLAPAIALLALPAVTGLSWTVGSVALAVIGAATAIATLANAIPTTERPWVSGAAALIAAYAILLASGGVTVFAGVTGGLALVAGGISIAAHRAHPSMTGPFAATAIGLAAIAQPAALWAVDLPVGTIAAVSCLTIAGGTLLIAAWIAVAAATDGGDWKNRRVIAAGVAIAALITSLTSVNLLAGDSGAEFVPPSALLLAAVTIAALALSPSAMTNRLAVAGSGVATITATGFALAIAVGGEHLLIHTGLVALVAAYLKWRRTTVTVLRDGLMWSALVVGGVCAGIAAIAAIEAWTVAVLAEAPHLATWRTPIVLLVVAAALTILPAWRIRFDAAALTAVLALGSVPAVWLPHLWWSAPLIAALSGAALLAWTAYGPNPTTSGTRFGVGLALFGYGVLAALGESPSTVADRFGAAAVLGGLTLASTVLALLARNRDRRFGGLGVAVALTALPTSIAVVGVAAEWSRSLATPITIGAAAVGLLVAGILHIRQSDYVRWATAVVPVTATGAALTGLGLAASGVYSATAGLIGVGAAMLMLPDRTKAAIRTGLAAIPIVITATLSLPVAVQAIALPYGWLGAVWSRTPNSTIDGLTPEPVPLLGTVWDVGALTMAAVAVVLAALGLSRRRWWIPVTVATSALVLPTIPLVTDAPWPVLPMTATALGIAAYLVVSCVRLPSNQIALPVAVAILVGGSGLAGALAAPVPTLVVLGATGIATIVAALVGVATSARAAGWLLTAASLTGFAIAAGVHAGLPARSVAFGVLAVAVALLAVAATRASFLAGAGWAAEIGGWGAAVIGLTLAGETKPHLAIAFVVVGACAALFALRAFASGAEKLLAPGRLYAWTGGLCALVAYWLLVNDAGISTVEYYTVPFALLTVLAGWLEFRRHPRMRSWVAYGPALALGLLPTLAIALGEADDPTRRILLGAATLVVLLLGVWRRLQAPVVSSGAVLILLALWEIILLWRSVPFWAPLAVAGILLLVVGATFEKRRRDVVRLARQLGSMR